MDVMGLQAPVLQGSVHGIGSAQARINTIRMSTTDHHILTFFLGGGWVHSEHFEDFEEVGEHLLLPFIRNEKYSGIQADTQLNQQRHGLQPLVSMPSFLRSPVCTHTCINACLAFFSDAMVPIVV